MKISIQNYEAFVLDFLEGNLSEQKQAEMLLFLEQNPHLQTEIDDLLDENLVLTADETIVFEDKSILKKQERQSAGSNKTKKIQKCSELLAAIRSDSKTIWRTKSNFQYLQGDVQCLQRHRSNEAFFGVYGTLPQFCR